MATSEPNAPPHEREPDVASMRWERILTASKWGVIVIAVAGFVFSRTGLGPTAEPILYRAAGALILVIVVIGCLLISGTAKRNTDALRSFSIRLILLGGALLLPLVACLAILLLLLGPSPLSKDVHDLLIVPVMVLLGIFLFGGALLLLGCTVGIGELIAEYGRSRRSAQIS